MCVCVCVCVEMTCFLETEAERRAAVWLLFCSTVSVYSLTHYTHTHFPLLFPIPTSRK